MWNKAFISFETSWLWCLRFRTQCVLVEYFVYLCLLSLFSSLLKSMCFYRPFISKIPFGGIAHYYSHRLNVHRILPVQYQAWFFVFSDECNNSFFHWDFCFLGHSCQGDLSVSNTINCSLSDHSCCPIGEYCVNGQCNPDDNGRFYFHSRPIFR